MTTLARLKTATTGIARALAGPTLGLGLALATSPTLATAQIVPVPLVRPATGAGPALWVIRDADSTLYLFGTIHMLRPDTGWGTDRVDAAFNTASEIWFEIANPGDEAAVLPLIQQYGISPATPLSSLLTPDEIAKLDVAARNLGASAAQMDTFRPWFAGLLLSIGTVTSAGYDPLSGVELRLLARARENNKPIKAFETDDFQVRLFASMPQDIQLEFLRDTLKNFETSSVMLDEMVAAWAQGDVASLERITITDLKVDAPQVYDALFVRRNTDFANQIQTLLAGSGTAFIAVGAAHLIGEDSVQAMLAQRGITVVRE